MTIPNLRNSPSILPRTNIRVRARERSRARDKSFHFQTYLLSLLFHRASSLASFVKASVLPSLMNALSKRGRVSINIFDRRRCRLIDEQYSWCKCFIIIFLHNKRTLLRLTSSLASIQRNDIPNQLFQVSVVRVSRD